MITLTYGPKQFTAWRTGTQVWYEDGAVKANKELASEPAAIREYRRLVLSRLSRGFQVPGTGKPPVQLLEAVEHQEIPRLLKDPLWWLQRKYDGERLLVRVIGDLVIGYNREGRLTDAPELPPLPACLLDGEIVNDVYYVFDVLEADGQALLHLPYRDRFDILARLGVPNVVPTGRTTDEKQRMLKEALDLNLEGVVWKRTDSTYQGVRTNTWLKSKFWKTLSARVRAHNVKRSVAMELLGPDGWVPVGDVTVKPKQTVPAVGSVIEVKYLYAFPETHKLFQPELLRSRTDISDTDCTLTQARYRGALA
jgi:bifunctional non-homologous end joining protein LigD